MRLTELAKHQCDLTVSELFHAYYDCRRNKRNSDNALAFEVNMEDSLLSLYEELTSCEYTPGRGYCFVVEYPKIREVWAADFKDRIVHHVLYNRISDQYFRRFLATTYSCIPGRGTPAAVTKIKKNVRSVTQNYTQPGWVLKMDVSNFFASIDRSILDEQLARQIKHPWLVWLYKTILHHDPIKNVVMLSPKHLYAKVPAHKSLFNTGDKGLPIGNLSSQIFANVYLDDLDQYAKHRLCIPYWVRYVDDIIVIGDTTEELSAYIEPIDSYIKEHLGLSLHPNKVSINDIYLGFDALGYVIRPYAQYLRRSTIDHGYASLKKLCDRKAHPHKIAAVANSYFSLLRQCNAWGERERLANFLRERGYLVSPKLNRMFYGIVE